ncbi:hypothetical protein ACO1O0_007847 [Amphichorda felina]
MAVVGFSDPFELIYWPGLPGRGEFIRLLFEEAGVAYTDTAQASNPDEAVQKVIGVMSNDQPGNPPLLAPPFLRHGDLILSQMPNILQYLAPKLGLSTDGPNAAFYLNQIVLTLNDGFVNEIHDTHHPIAVSLYYADQKPEAKKRAASFTSERLPKFLGYAQRVLSAKTSGDGPWLYGGKLTYADLFLFQCVDGTLFAFPKTMAKLKGSGEYDAVFALYDAVKERPNIKAYLASDRRQAYGEGIYRHYPELEE